MGRYLNEIAVEVKIIKKNLDDSDKALLADANKMRSLKYSVLTISEAMGQVLQHILAKNYDVAITSYSKLIEKSRENEILKEDLNQKLKPFFNFRNMLAYRYWEIDDHTFINNLRNGVDDFIEFRIAIRDFIVQSK